MRTCLLVLGLLGCGGDDDDARPDSGAEPDAAAEPDAGGEDAAVADPLRVETAEGPVRGAETDGVRSFLAIPFAAPPVGAARWRPPAPVQPWTDERDGTVRGAPCPQFGLIGTDYVDESDEDCLTLNVFAPATAGDARRPVLLWFHGGGFTSGTAAEELYDGTDLVADRDVVVVTANYRLGPLGYLLSPALLDEQGDAEGPGNYGLLDQRAAMEWVRRNAAAFGGDAADVTVFGESAGGMGICFHLVSPGSAGLFERAIIESGSCLLPTPDEERASSTAALLEDAVGCSDGDVLECLRAKTAREIVEALGGARPTSLLDAFTWFPVVEGHVLPEPAAAVFAAGAQQAVPVLIGTNHDEGSLLVELGGYGDVSAEELEELVRANVPEEHAEAVIAAYSLADYASPKQALSALVGDALFVCPARRLARSVAAEGQPVWLYSFDQPGDLPVFPDAGAFHGSELPFVWGNGFLGGALTAEEEGLSDEMQGYWARFAASGDPNGEAAVAWPAYDEAGAGHLVLALPLPVQPARDLRAPQCEALDPIAGP